MAQARRSTARSKSTGARSTSRSRTTPRGPRALDRLDKSIDAAEGALKDLRSELGRGGRDLVKDLDRTLRDSRKNLRSLSRTVAKDLGKLQRAATTGKTTAPGAAGWRAKDNDEEHPVELSKEAARIARKSCRERVLRLSKQSVALPLQSAPRVQSPALAFRA